MQRRYTYADYLTLLSVDPIYETVVDPLIASTLLNHDVKKDKAYADNPEDNENKAKMYGPFLSRGFKEDERLYIAWTGPERGFGAFASVGIPTGTPIGIYAGVVTNQSVGSRYSWHYNSDHEIQNEEGATIGLSLDAWHRGNHLRFVNHDEYPNCVSALGLDLAVRRFRSRRLTPDPLPRTERRNGRLEQPLARPLRDKQSNQTRRRSHGVLWKRVLVGSATGTQSRVYRGLRGGGPSRGAAAATSSGRWDGHRD